MRTVAFWLSLILIFTIPWELIIKFPGIGTVTRGIGIFVAGFWVLTVVASGEFRKPHLLHLAIFLFVLWNLVSSFWSVNISDTVINLQRLVQLAILSLILWDLYTTPKYLRIGLQAYIFGAYVSIADTINNFLSGNPSNQMGNRFGATGFNVNDLSLILAVGIPVAWYLASSQSYGKKGYILKVVNYCYIPAAFFSILLTASRGGLIATFPAFLYIILSFDQFKLSSRILILILLTSSMFAVLEFVPQASFDRLSTAATSISTGDLSGRGHIWLEGIQVFVDHPIIGVGSRGFRHAIESGRPPHNTFLSVLVDLGIIGFVLFAFTLAITVFHAIQQSKRESRLWLTILLILAVGFMIHNAEQKKIVWLFLTLIVVTANLPRTSDEPRRRSNFPVLSREVLKGKPNDEYEAISLAKGNVLGNTSADNKLPARYEPGRVGHHFSYK